MFVLYIIGVIATVFIIYSLLPTLLMRGLSIGVFNRSGVKGKLSLTFDDGPNPLYTPRLLDLLKQYHIKATFFVVGSFAEQNPELLKRMDQEGHEVGIHHYKHTSNWLLSPFAAHREVAKTAEVIENIIGKKPHFYRPPWGHLNLFSSWARRPYRLVIWSAILGDWNKKVGKVRLEKRIRNSVKDGAIIVLHDNDQTPGADAGAPEIMLGALQDVLKDVHDKFDFVTVSGLYKESTKRN
ncbi:MAG: polysaccharide deacetylase family protein [Tuberibacillus sp.]